MKQFDKTKIIMCCAAVLCLIVAVITVKKCTSHNYKDAPFVQKTPKHPGKIKSPKVEIAKAKIGEVELYINCVGNLKPNSQVVIRSEIEGIIKTIHFTEGTDVTNGQLLISFDDSLAVAKYNEILARLTHSKAEYERAKGLQTKKYISDSEVFKREAEMKSLAAQSEVAKIELSKYKIYSPMNGRIGLIDIAPGDYVQRGSQLASIVNDTPLEVEFRIPELQLANVSVGQTIIITTENNPSEYYGTIKAISPVSEKSSHMVIARAVLDDHDSNIVSGQFANVKIITEHSDKATLIPETAVMRTNGEDFVYRVVDGVALRTNVVIGAFQQKGNVEVLSGIFPGDTVVTKGHIRVQDGQPVKIVNNDAIYKGMDILNSAKDSNALPQVENKKEENPVTTDAKKPTVNKSEPTAKQNKTTEKK